MDFDLQTGIVSVVIALTYALTIYFIVEFSLKRSSYDDLKASKRQDRTSTLAHMENSNSDNKKLKKLKKKIKSVKNSHNENGEDNQCIDITNELVLPQKNSVLLPETEEISKNVEQLPASDSKKKLKSKPKSSKKSQVIVGKIATTPLVASPIQKKVEKLIEADRESSNSSSNTDQVAVVEIDSSPQHTAEENLTNELMASKIKTKKTKKKKSDFNFNDVNGRIKGGLTVNNILSILQQSAFSHSELQILIDALLNKEDDNEWFQGKQDPLLKLKKQLVEIEKLHSDDMDTISGLQAKLSSLRTELNTEKANSKNLRDVVFKSNNDLQSMSSKLQQYLDENQSLILDIQEVQQEVNEGRLVISKLEEKLMLSVKLEEQTAAQQQMSVPHEQHQEAVLTLQGQVNHLASQLQEKQNINATLGGQLQEYRSLNADLDNMLQNAHFEAGQVKKELTAMSKKMEESHLEVSELRNKVNTLEGRKNELVTENEHLKVEVSKLNQEIRTLQQKRTESLEESKKNGNVNTPALDHSKCQAQIEEKESCVKNLDTELYKKDSVIEKLTNEIIACKNDSNKKQTVIDILNSDLIALKNDSAKLFGDLNEEKCESAKLRNSLSEKSEGFNQIMIELESYKKKNNELRSKNWKVVEALENAEATLKKMSLKETNQVANDANKIALIRLRVGDMIQHLIPRHNINEASHIEDTEVWLSKLEEVVNAVEQDSRNSESQAQQIMQLQNLVTHYRAVINDLEKMLHNLEMRIQNEDKKLRSIKAENSIVSVEDED